MHTSVQLVNRQPTHAPTCFHWSITMSFTLPTFFGVRSWRPEYLVNNRPSPNGNRLCEPLGPPVSLEVTVADAPPPDLTYPQPATLAYSIL